MLVGDRFLGWTARLRDLVRAPIPGHAHCDIPCGIYDPHEAQIAALTVLRMGQMLNELKLPGPGTTPLDAVKFDSQCARLTAVKEQHAERCKHELRVLWGDYFTPDHAKAHPDLPDRFWKALKAASKARQSADLADAQELVKQVQEIAELFWKTKDAKTARVPTHAKVGGELVVPVS